MYILLGLIHFNLHCFHSEEIKIRKNHLFPESRRQFFINVCIRCNLFPQKEFVYYRYQRKSVTIKMNKFILMKNTPHIHLSIGINSLKFVYENNFHEIYLIKINRMLFTLQFFTARNNIITFRVPPCLEIFLNEFYLSF